jgi:hypothetical protein
VGQTVFVRVVVMVVVGMEVGRTAAEGVRVGDSVEVGSEDGELVMDEAGVIGVVEGVEEGREVGEEAGSVVRIMTEVGVPLLEGMLAVTVS